MKIFLSVPARIHLTLIELGPEGYRRNGGLGFALNGISRRLVFEPSNDLSLERLVDVGYSEPDIHDLHTLLQEVSAEKGFASVIRLLEATGQGRHVGTGSGTGITLACLEALFAINNVEVEKSELVRCSGRGGTSGVGITTYFAGGFVLDVGREWDNLPVVSSDDQKSPSNLPQVLVQAPMPEWPIAVLSPDFDPAPVTQERAIFQSLRTSPLSAAQVHETAYHAVLGVSAAVVAADYVSFCRAIDALQRTEWKSREIKAYGERLLEIMARMRALGCDCVGLSSMGPTLFFTARDMARVALALRAEFPDAQVLIASINNSGREISHA
ncbi:beta-ribofuranosylaminobenzene 5'-phosphate synthase family protein [Burkholderia gladioli]|uniref:beta-ribofuranosylaminobenzene 5'-phosphate synthase family protein n=1 Tax=Burkholderia gladioli TaxID=28095 RepID=UPI00163FA15B|nr:beta-ribofuranosylaminobenzene 5'-phosphate synthase family protein [Burkholderia gladioli]